MISNLTLVSGVRLCIRNWLNFFSPSKAALNISSTLGTTFWWNNNAMGKEPGCLQTVARRFLQFKSFHRYDVVVVSSLKHLTRSCSFFFF